MTGSPQWPPRRRWFRRLAGFFSDPYQFGDQKRPWGPKGFPARWSRFRRAAAARPWRLWSFRAIARWCRQSPGFRHFLFGLPSMAATAAVIVVVVQVARASRVEIATDYWVEGHGRLLAKDYPAARVCFEQLALMDPSNQETRFRLAQVLDAMDQKVRAANLMNSLAAGPPPGYPPAHFWLAERLIGAQPPSQESYKAAETHLKAILKRQPSSADARALLGQLYTATGRTPEAESMLASVVRDRPDLLVMLAQVCKLQGKVEAANRWGHEALGHYDRAVKSRPEDAQSRTWLAFAECYFGRFERAEAILQEGRDGSEASPLLRQSLSQVYATWIDALRRETRDTVGPRLALLERGLRQDPTDSGLLLRLAASFEAGGEEAGRAREALQTVLATGQATGLTHFMLGLEAWSRGRAEEAALHWERAYQINPETPSVANNLAWALAMGPRPDLPRALLLINRVIERKPNVIQFQSTRGFVLLKMKRWKEALPDLESALLAGQPQPELHRALAEVYDNLKMPEIAAKHRLQDGAAQHPGP